MEYGKCAEKGCERAAQFAPKICVPATGYPQDPKKSLVSILGVKLCKEHCETFPAREQFYSGETKTDWRMIFTIMARAAGSSVPPDFNRAWVIPIPVDGEEYQQFEKIQSYSGFKSLSPPTSRN